MKLVNIEIPNPGFPYDERGYRVTEPREARLKFEGNCDDEYRCIIHVLSKDLQHKLSELVNEIESELKNRIGL